MKKILIIALKIIGMILGVLLLLAAILFFRATNYKMHDLAIDRTKFAQVTSPQEIDQLAQDLVSQMSLHEKIGQMYGEKLGQVLPRLAINFLAYGRFPHVYVGYNKRLNIPPWVLSDGPRGARVMHPDIDGVTTFPVAMSRGASWNVDLERRVHDVIAIEMRANQTNYGATPCINLLRHPGWGRAQETYGEDPWLLGEFGLAAVQSLEKHNVMACPKHFALNSVENSRFDINVTVDERTLREVYLPHFKKVIQKGKPGSLMSAYNKVLGEYCGNNKYLLTSILRDEWGFEGFVSSDWINGVYDGVASVQAGLDVEMPWQKAYSHKALEAGIADGQITEADISLLAQRSLRTRLKYLFAEDEMEYPLSLIGSQSHIDLAREAAEEGMVLVKNEEILPFEATSATIAIIGRLANKKNLGDHGSSNSTPPYVITPYDGIRELHESLGGRVLLYDGTEMDSIKAVASKADKIIVVAGFTFENEGEYIIVSRERARLSAEAGEAVGAPGTGGDRADLRLPAIDEETIRAVASVNQEMVVVYVGGSGIDMSPWIQEVPAVLFAWYSGMEGGTALANVLCGRVNPSGKLPFSIAADQSDYPKFTPFATEITYEYYHGYTLFDKKGTEVVYPFGHGLSYTSFELSELEVTDPDLSPADTVRAVVNLTNSGSRDGAEVVQLYIGFSNSSVDRPVKLLRDFRKIHLASGESTSVALEVLVSDIGWYDEESRSWQIEEMEYELYIGNTSEHGSLLEGRFEVKSD